MYNFYTYIVFIGLPNSQSQETITDLPVFMANDYYYKNAKTPRMLYFNEVLSDLHDSSNVLPKLVFEEYLFTEREYRWKRKCKLDQLSKELEFIMGENPACLGYYVKRMKKISRSNFSKMKAEVEKLRKMQEILSAEVNDITEENTKLYKQVIIRKGYENQNEYYTRILDRIINEQQKLNEFIEHGENLLKIGTCILPEKTKGKEHINRRKRENKRKVRKQKEKRLFTACEKLLKRLVSQETYIKCCPKIFSFNSQYRIKVEELLTNGLDSIRSRQELAAIKKLTASDFLETEAVEKLKNSYNKKFKSSISKLYIKSIEKSDLDEAESDTLEIQDILVDKESESSGDESDPFDLITVKVLGPDGLYVDV